MNGCQHTAIVGAETDIRIGVADFTDRFAGDILIIDRSTGGDLARNNHKSSGDKRFTGDPALGIIFHCGVDNTIGDTIGNLVRMPFRH